MAKTEAPPVAESRPETDEAYDAMAETQERKPDDCDGEAVNESDVPPPTTPIKSLGCEC